MTEHLYDLITDRAEGPLAEVLKCFLWVLSLGYGIVVRVRAVFYRQGTLKQYDLQRPVISVGNITWGGVGKTPLVESLARFFKEKRKKVVILTRGYMPRGGSRRGGIRDEARFLEESLPGVVVLAGADRLANAKRALQELDPDLFILDDGFQHRRVRRDLDIVVIDTTNPFGNGQLIPRGILREPLTALARADMFVLSKSDRGRGQIPQITAALKNLNPKALIAESVHQPAGLFELKTGAGHSVDLLKAKPVVGFCAIGDPGSFQDSLRSLEARVEKLFIFMDHYVYGDEDLRRIVSFCREKKISSVVTTQKDAVKLGERLGLFEGLQVFSLKIRHNITEGQDQFYARISSLLDR